jgi:Holliday junction resolvasome RuvABC endonuclease subunit
MLVIGIDPASNTVGLAIFDPETRDLFVFEQLVAPKSKDVHKRIRYLNEAVSFHTLNMDPNERTYAFIEDTVMRGRSGQILAFATGSLIATIPSHCEFATIRNTTVKKLVGGKGDADKVEVARGVLKWAQGNEETVEKVRAAIQAGKFDQLDALAIGIAGLSREYQNG